MLIDTHAHLNFNAYSKDLEKVIKRSLENNIWLINVGSNFQTSKKAIEISKRYDKGVYSAVGLHPIHLNEGIFKIKEDSEEMVSNFKKIKKGNFDYKEYKKLALSKKVVAIGETGLDYYYRPKTKTKMEQYKERQKTVFLEHLKLAEELSLPIVFHCRMAHQEIIEILEKNFGKNMPKGVIHCFTGNIKEAQKYLEMGFSLGLNGIIFKLNLIEVIKKTPLERILIETDCPYLTPPPFEGRNEPLFVKYIGEEIAKIKEINFEELALKTTENAKKLFKI